jgi:hypothetical protein
LSAAEREAERESERKLRVVLVEMLKLVAEKPESLKMNRLLSRV